MGAVDCRGQQSIPNGGTTKSTAALAGNNEQETIVPDSLIQTLREYFDMDSYDSIGRNVPSFSGMQETV